MATSWNEIDTLIGRTERMNSLKAAINTHGRLFEDEDIYMLAIQGYVPTDSNIRLLIESKIGIDSLRNTRSI